MTPEEHYDAADTILANFRNPKIPAGSDQDSMLKLMMAQVHATLALRQTPTGPTFVPTDDEWRLSYSDPTAGIVPTTIDPSIVDGTASTGYPDEDDYDRG
jgi:hypothetical protein